VDSPIKKRASILVADGGAEIKDKKSRIKYTKVVYERKISTPFSRSEKTFFGGRYSQKVAFMLVWYKNFSGFLKKVLTSGRYEIH
jgi:hypothetical protein